MTDEKSAPQSFGTTPHNPASEGPATEADASGDRIAPRERTYDLADMLNRITPDNLHPEQDFGTVGGNEPR